MTEIARIFALEEKKGIEELFGPEQVLEPHEEEAEVFFMKKLGDHLQWLQDGYLDFVERARAQEVV